MLGAADPVTWCPRRIAVAGASGAGKTTFAVRLSRRLGIPHVEIDGLFHGPGWTPRREFLDDVEGVTAATCWVIEWQYDDARELIVRRADTVVWLDLPTRVTLTRLVRRTIRRRLLRTPLWHGNREGPLHRVLVDPEHIIRHGYRTRHSYRALVPAVDEQHTGLRVVRLTSRRDVESWLRGIGPLRGSP